MEEAWSVRPLLLRSRLHWAVFRSPGVAQARCLRLHAPHLQMTKRADSTGADCEHIHDTPARADQATYGRPTTTTARLLTA